MEGEPSLFAAVASVKDARARSPDPSLPSLSGDGGGVGLPTALPPLPSLTKQPVATAAATIAYLALLHELA